MLPTSFPKIILVVRNTRVLRAINYHVSPYYICVEVGSIWDLVLYYTSHVAVCLRL
jgi:hypothetical protein